MSPANWSLLIGALIAGGLSFRNPRGLLWILAAAIDYAASVAYWRSGFPYPEFFGGMCDAAVALSIYFLARERWELGLFRVFQASLLVNIFFLAGTLGVIPVVSTDVVSILLEACNWLTLLLIGGTGVAQWIGAPHDPAHRAFDRVYHLVRPLREARKTPSFIEAGK